MLGLRGKGEWSLFTIDKMKESQSPMEASVFLSLLFIVLFGAGLYFAWRRNKYVLFLLLLCTTLAGVTFAALHTFWNQDRLVVIFLPFLFLGVLYGIYGFGNARNSAAFKVLAPVVAGLVVLIQLGSALSAASSHSKFVKHYMKGDYFYGYPDALANYLKTAEWAGENLTDSNQVACNKPAEAVAYGHRLIFTRLPKPLPQTPDSLFIAMKSKKITHLLYDAAGFGQVSDVAQYLYQLNPKMLTADHQEGNEQSSMSILLRINYEK
jgi:hypothetical protein